MMTITYEYEGALYVNLTNRCSCSFSSSSTGRAVACRGTGREVEMERRPDADGCCWGASGGVWAYAPNGHDDTSRAAANVTATVRMQCSLTEHNQRLRESLHIG